MNCNHVMVDIETLSTGDNAAICAIGAVRFDPVARYISTPEGSFYQVVDLERTAKDKLGVIDGPTVLWWLGQRDAQAATFDQTDALELSQVLLNFNMWALHDDAQPTDHFWSHSIFDQTLLRQAFERCGWTWDLHRKQSRDMHTLRYLGEALGVERPLQVGTKHSALDDAFNQAGYAIEVLNRILTP